MSAKSVYPSLQATNGFAITASDTVDIKSDAGNTEGVSAVYLHNVAAGATCRVLPAGQTGTVTPITIYLSQGQVFPLAVKRVYATSPVPPSGLIGLYGKQNI